MQAGDFLKQEEKKLIEQTIAMTEKETSGEIRVHIDLHCKMPDIKDCASYVFAKLGMHKTKLRNGVLIYVAILDRKFAIIGDIGINRVVPENFWESEKEILLEYFKQEKYAEGIIKVICEIGEKLKTYFPFHPDDENELENSVSF